MKLRINLTKYFLAAFFSIFAITNSAQTPPGEQTGCTLTDKKQRAQIITYDGLRANYVSLRLRNNTNCPIIVETDDDSPQDERRFVTLPNGAVRYEISELNNGAQIRVHYLLRNPKKQTIKRGYGWGDSVGTYKIQPGRAILFEVPLAKLKERYDMIAVPFVYEWEDDFVLAGMTGGVQHHVYFLTDDLPAEIQPKK